jgi:serine protease AprX
MSTRGVSWDDPGSRRTARLLVIAMLAALAAPAVAATGEPPTAGAWASAGWESAGNLVYTESYPGSLYQIVTNQVNADDVWKAGFTGAGVDVALIDTGVVPVNGLTYPGKVVNGPDLSFESQDPDLRYLDTYGHGTHMAGIIAGRDDSASTIAPDKAKFLGVAPGARIVNLKVADYQGSVDVSQVIAAVDWVTQNRTSNGMNIRVLNLSFGTDSLQPYLIDPLAYAVEQAWKAGIVVVVAAGNDGNGAPLRNPALDPYVIAVGASHANTSTPVGDDAVAAFSNCTATGRSVDVLAPGKSIVSLRNPGSYADATYPQARVSDRFFLGSGTSQAAAVVSGAAALLVQQRPTATPDQIKQLLKATATTLQGAAAECQGAGVIDVNAARRASTPKNATQSYGWSLGKGLLEGSRGSMHLSHDGVVLQGEQDIFGKPWTPWCTYAGCTTTKWTAPGTWNGSTWTGAGWSGTSWSGTSWSGTSWSGTSWSGTSWSGISWSGMSWSGTSWSGTSWSGTSWSGTSWSGMSWSCAGGHTRGQSWD